jgi:serine phosphatase RsbU (regulator of sigma subunit)
MAEVDAAIRADASDYGRFATVCYLQIDVGNSASVRWARAGHPRPILVSAAGSPRFCDGADGPPLGISAGHGSSSWSVGEFSIDADESLVIYTDGLTDSRVDATGEQFGEDQLVDMIRSFDAPCETAGKLVAHLAQGLRLIARERRDDVAVMVVSSTSTPRSTPRSTPTSTSRATEQT